MASSADDYLKQANDLLRWANDCEAVAKKFREAAADLIQLAKLMSSSASVTQQQQQIQPDTPEQPGMPTKLRYD
jgi:hypothetical protein